MANKKIGDLQLRSDFDDTVSFPVDDALQTWRCTGAQVRAALLGNDSIALNMIPDGLITAAKLAAGAVAKYAMAAKTANYTLVNTDNVVTGDASSAAFTLTLPTAASNAGRIFLLKKIDSSVNAITIATTSSQTIDGVTTRKLCTKNEFYKVVSDGTNWLILDHSYPSVWELDANFAPSAGFGTVSSQAIYRKRVGDSMHVRGYFKSGTVAGSTAYIQLPTGYTIATSKLPGTAVQGLGVGNRVATGSAQPFGGAAASASGSVVMFFDGSTSNQIFVGVQSSSNVIEKFNVNGSGGFASSDGLTFDFVVPITDWEG